MLQKLIAILLAVIVAQLGIMTFHNLRLSSPPAFSTPYQAVVLTGGQVYYGRLENAAGMYPILRDVFYIASQVNPETKVTSNILIRRGKELHGPEYMVLNRQSILFFEPIKEDSQIAKFIAEQNKSK